MSEETTARNAALLFKPENLGRYPVAVPGAFGFLMTA
jgi:hypothetical protein